MIDASQRATLELIVDSLKVRVYRSSDDAGRAAATDVAAAIASAQKTASIANVIFAAAPSQDFLLKYLCADSNIDWPRVAMFHMDEYLQISIDQEASFRHYLSMHLLDKVSPRDVHLIGGAEVVTQAACDDYNTLMSHTRPDVVCAGIGENGHLAFNDPPAADFHDPVCVKIVQLDQACREQQVHDGCFEKLTDVPTYAVTLTIPTLLRARAIAVVVSGSRKARAIAAVLHGEISTACPASCLRTHSGATLYLDPEAAKYIS